MKKQLLIAVAGGVSFIVSYFLLRKKYAGVNKVPQFNGNRAHPGHHLTKVFAKAKKHATA